MTDQSYLFEHQVAKYLEVRFQAEIAVGSVRLGYKSSCYLTLGIRTGWIHRAGSKPETSPSRHHVCQTSSTYLNRNRCDIYHWIDSSDHTAVGNYLLGEEARGVLLQCRYCVARGIYDIVPENPWDSIPIIPLT